MSDPQPFGTVGPADWGDKPCFIVGGGPSLLPFVSSLASIHLKGHVVAVNDCYLRCSPDAIVTIDQTWLRERKAAIPGMPAPVYAAVSDDNARPALGNIVYLKRGESPRRTIHLSTDPSTIANGLCSGFAAFNFAFLRHARTIYLLGIDFTPGENGRSHWHDGYRWHSPRSAGRLYQAWARKFDEVLHQVEAVGVEAINCSPTKMLKGYKHVPYQEALA
jgi:hypothetical protein